MLTTQSFNFFNFFHYAQLSHWSLPTTGMSHSLCSLAK